MMADHVRIGRFVDCVFGAISVQPTRLILLGETLLTHA